MALFSKHLFELNNKYYIEENMKITKMLPCLLLNISSQIETKLVLKRQGSLLMGKSVDLKCKFKNQCGKQVYTLFATSKLLKYTGTNLILEVEIEEIRMHLFVFLQVVCTKKSLKGKIQEQVL